MKAHSPLAEVNPMEYAPIYPHVPIEEIGTDVFMARGSIKMDPTVRITCNMGIIREDGDVTLINPIRLNEDGEKQLKSLGNVRRVIRLGAFHGVDDPYYVEQFTGQNPVTADRLPKENVNRPNLVKGDDPRRRIAERRV